MKIVLQRVKKASVSVDNQIVASIEQGLLLLVGFHGADSQKEIEWLARKCIEIRIFNDAAGKMNYSLGDTNGSVLIVSQFTLYGDCSHGRRPGFTGAAEPALAEKLYNQFVLCMKSLVPNVQTGIFGANMQVELMNDGPVTFILERNAGS